jgi:hypothetical protein
MHRQACQQVDIELNASLIVLGSTSEIILYFFYWAKLMSILRCPSDWIRFGGFWPRAFVVVLILSTKYW